MADKKITELAAATALASVDQFPVVQGGATKRATVADLSAAYESASGNLLTVGQETLPRHIVAGTNVATPPSGRILLAYFTARKTETIAQLSATTVTAAGITPTLCKMGCYSVAANGDLTLVGATANDITLFAAASTSYARATTASFGVTLGQRYAFGVVVVSAAAMPNFNGINQINSTEAARAPRLAAALSGQADLPASITDASLSALNGMIYGVLLP